ncbi:hypothetical protein BegalDRAFT_2268 [Beggiatoa alba B18LD]|uniref:DUF4351 domain-containing protein n=1 Tax=Beggiatoa alba B18LD TaxID=395493 RepID=I3CHM9_9GAMM|nr:hypothetical protein [Beggiatoa alba]EIJ43122.1 hypothetical protein BegalDRAFT_2268 [Beggiatoa alba B18LD]
MAEKDIVSKHILKRLAIDMARYLFDLEVEKVELVETEYQRVEDRRADLVVQVEEPERYLLHIEIQNNNENNMPIRMLRYFCEISAAYPAEEIKQYIIYIGRNPLRMADNIQRDNLHYRYTIIDMHRMDCQQFLAQNNPDALVMAILCDFKDRPPRSVVQEIIQRLDNICADNLSKFRDYLTMLEILSDNRNLQKLVKEEQEMLSTMKLSELPSYEIGIERGWQKGLQEGLQEGRQAGRQETLVELLVQGLTHKFGQLPQALEEQIIHADIDTLRQWSMALLEATSLEAVFQNTIAIKPN